MCWCLKVTAGREGGDWVLGRALQGAMHVSLVDRDIESRVS